MGALLTCGPQNGDELELSSWRAGDPMVDHLEQPVPSDFTAYYKRFPISPAQIPLLATSFDIDGVTYLALPLTGPFGLQDSNAMAKCTTEIIHAISASRQRASWGIVLSSIYVDDAIFFAPRAVMDALLAAHVEISDAVLGADSIAHKKTGYGPVRDALGFRFDCPAETVGLTPTWFEKLLAVLFLELPADPQPGRHAPLRLLQRAAAYMIRTSEVVVAMRPFSFGIYRCIAKVPDSPRSTSWPPRGRASCDAPRGPHSHAPRTAKSCANPRCARRTAGTRRPAPPQTQPPSQPRPAFAAAQNAAATPLPRHPTTGTDTPTTDGPCPTAPPAATSASQSRRCA